MSTPRLNAETLGLTRKHVRLPAYDRGAVRPGIVHLGLGAFARAHLAAYTDDVLSQRAGATLDWGIVGVSLRRPDQRDALQPQDGLYTLLERGSEGVAARVIGAVLRVLVAPEDPGAALEAMADPATRIVSLTVTEKGYCHDPATGRLHPHHPDIAHDIANPSAPASAPGYLVAALALRRARGLRPFTVLCCDNLPHNGRVVAGIVHDLAALNDLDLARWIQAEGAFPCTMVDRIVPATTAADIAEAEALTGLVDAAPVTHEPFRQWVIEECFVDGARPEWEVAGAELVSDVAPYETMKLRMLNGAHSSLAYLGYLAGHETVRDAMDDPVFDAFVRKMWREEIIPTLKDMPRERLEAYADDLRARFLNPAIRHRLWQIAMDGSQKLPQRLLGTIADRLARGQDVNCLCLAVAGWIAYVGGMDENGAAIDVRDPLAERLKAALKAAGPEPAARVKAVLGQRAVFSEALAADVRFVRAMAASYEGCLRDGARASVGLAGEM